MLDVLDGDLAPIELCFIHRMSSRLCSLVTLVLHGAITARLAALVETNTRVHYLAKFLEGLAQLVAINAKGQVADVDGEGGGLLCSAI